MSDAVVWVYQDCLSNKNDLNNVWIKFKVIKFDGDCEMWQVLRVVFEGRGIAFLSLDSTMEDAMLGINHQQYIFPCISDQRFFLLTFLLSINSLTGSMCTDLNFQVEHL